MEVIPCKITEIATPGSKTAAFGKRLGKKREEAGNIPWLAGRALIEA